MNKPTRWVLGTLLISGLSGCSGTKPADLGLIDDQLRPCPSSPNCVTSDNADADHKIEPLHYSDDAGVVWDALKVVLAALPRTTIVNDEDLYLHAEAESRVFGFVDDVEFHLRPSDKIIAVRSASRVGRSDFGVNAERIETIRNELKAKNLLR